MVFNFAVAFSVGVVPKRLVCLAYKKGTFREPIGLFLLFSKENKVIPVVVAAVEVKKQLQVTRTVKIANKAGFHLRPINQIVKIAENSQADVTLAFKSCRADCKSSWDLLALIGAEEGDELTLCADGSDAVEVADQIEALFLRKFGEDEFETSPE